jgi:hypothetical protein
VHLEHNADASLRLRQLLRAEFLFDFDPAISPPLTGRPTRASECKSFTQAHFCYSQDVSNTAPDDMFAATAGRTAGLSARGKLRLTCASCHPSCSRSTRTLLPVGRTTEGFLGAGSWCQECKSEGRAGGRGVRRAPSKSRSVLLPCDAGARGRGLCLWGVFLFC